MFFFVVCCRKIPKWLIAVYWAMISRARHRDIQIYEAIYYINMYSHHSPSNRTAQLLHICAPIYRGEVVATSIPKVNKRDAIKTLHDTILFVYTW